INLELRRDESDRRPRLVDQRREKISETLPRLEISLQFAANCARNSSRSHSMPWNNDKLTVRPSVIKINVCWAASGAGTDRTEGAPFNCFWGYPSRVGVLPKASCGL